MIVYVLRRLVAAVPTLVAVLTLVFLLVRVVPGDPAIAILGDRATPDAVAALRTQLGARSAVAGCSTRSSSGNSLTGGFRAEHGDGATDPGGCGGGVAAYDRSDGGGDGGGDRDRGAGGGGGGAAAERGGSMWRRGCCRLVGLSFPVFVSGIFFLLAFALHWRVFPVIGNANLNDPLDRLWKLVLPAIDAGAGDGGVYHPGNAQLDAAGVGGGIICGRRGRRGCRGGPGGVAAWVAECGDAGGDGGGALCGDIDRELGFDGDRVQ